MKVISIYYNEIKLGELTSTSNNYVYKANKNNVELAHKKGYPTFLYKCDNDFIATELPFSLQNFIPEKNKDALYLLAKIKDEDDKFEKLYKVANLQGNNQNFYIAID